MRVKVKEVKFSEVAEEGRKPRVSRSALNIYRVRVPGGLCDYVYIYIEATLNLSFSRSIFIPPPFIQAVIAACGHPKSIQHIEEKLRKIKARGERIREASVVDSPNTGASL